MSCQFHGDLWQFQTNLESIWELLRALMAASPADRIDILTRVTLVYVLQYAHLNGVYFSQEYHAVERKVEIMAPSRSPFTVESRSIVSTSIVFPHVLFAIFGPELSSI
jgi:hypothetical protein